ARECPCYSFLLNLKDGYDAFEAAGKPPIVKVCSKQYLVNVRFTGAPDPAPDAPCPHYSKIDPYSIQDIDGVPSTVRANMSRPDAAPRVPAVMTASMQPAPASAQAAPAPAVDMYASAGISRAAAKPSTAIAAAPKPPASPAYAASPAYDSPPASSGPVQTAQTRPSGTAAQPVNFQISVQPAASCASAQPAAA